MNKTAFLHGAKLCGQHFLRHRADGFFQFAETFGSGHQIPQNQHLPLIPDEGQRGFHGTGGKLVLCFDIIHFNPSKDSFMAEKIA